MLRTLLFVPADQPSKLAKAMHLPTDALVLDWEDAVLPENKGLARRMTLDFLRHRTGRKPAILVRLNPATGRYFEEDCFALREALPDGLVLSKCHSADEVARLDRWFEKNHNEDRLRFYPQVESPLGLVNAFAIASCSARVAGLAFGAEDFSAEMSITRTSGEPELLYARSALVTQGRAAGVEVIDSPCLEWKNPEKVRRDAQVARNLGFSGKLAIHPDQISILNEAFSPTAGEIEWARRILAAFSASGAGIIVVDGAMVDEAVVRRARGILAAGKE